MKIYLTRALGAILLSVFTSFYLSCAKDTDILVDNVIDSKDETEEKNPENGTEDFVVRTVVFSPIEDAHTQDTKGYNQYVLRLEQERRSSYVMFDLSALNGEITDIILQFTVDSDEGDGNIDIYKGQSSNWSEKELEPSNAPQKDVLLGSINTHYDLGTTQKITLNESEIFPERTTFVLNHTGSNDLAFASKEHPDRIGPKLVVTYNAVPGSEVPETNEEEEEETPEPEEEPAPDDRTFEDGFFVTTNGSPDNDGLTEATAWSIEHAFETAVAGNIIYIKAGDYGNKQLIVDNSGLEDKPIQFIGYTNTPGDIITNDQGSTFNYGDALNPNIMPLISGIVQNGEGQGDGIIANENYIEISNFQITKYDRGLITSGDYCAFKNIVITEIGDFNPSHSFPTGTSNPQLNYSGFAMSLEGNHTKVSDCFVLNAGAEGIRISLGRFQVHERNKVYSDNNINPSDYYYLITNGARSNTFRDCYIERVGNLEHEGHGLSLKVDASLNEFYDVSIKNTKIECSFSEVFDNVFERCTIEGGSDRTGLILVANGAHNNIFRECTIDNAGGITFRDWNDGFADSRDETDAGNNNQFISCVVKNGKVGINFDIWDELGAVAHNNTFTDCEFRDLDNLFFVNRPNELNRMENCIVENVTAFSASVFKNNKYTLDFQFDENTQFINNGFDKP